MRKTNWENFSKNAKQIAKNSKNIKQAGELLSDFPPEGYMRDNISKNLLKITECKSSSLRRYVRLLENFYFLITAEKDRKLILNKKIEIEKELAGRDDGILEKKD